MAEANQSLDADRIAREQGGRMAATASMEIQREYGLDVENPPDPLLIDDKTLVENPTMAMLVHQDVKVAHQQGYFGHRSTLWSVGCGLGCHKSCPRPPSTSARSD